MQIGLPNGYFYYSIPANFEQDFLKYNQKLKQKKLLLKGKKVDANFFRVFALGEPMTVDNDLQLLLTDLNGSIYYCYSLEFEEVPLKLLFSSIRKLFPNFENVLQRLQTGDYLSIDLTKKKIDKIIKKNKIVKVDIVELTKGRTYKATTLSLFNHFAIPLEKLEVSKKEKGMVHFQIEALDIETIFEVDDLENYTVFLNKILQKKQINLVCAIIHPLEWDQTIGLGFYNQQTYDKLLANGYLIAS